MKIVDLQSKEKRQAYQTPLLKNLGEVRELTRDITKGSAGGDNEGGVPDPRDFVGGPVGPGGGGMP